MKFEINPAVTADSAGIAHVQITSYRTAYKAFLPLPFYDTMTEAEQTRDWRELLSDAHHEPLFVAQRDDKVVGYALGKTHPDGFGAEIGELDAMHVLRDYQRH